MSIPSVLLAEKKGKTANTRWQNFTSWESIFLFAVLCFSSLLWYKSQLVSHIFPTNSETCKIPNLAFLCLIQKIKSKHEILILLSRIYHYREYRKFLDDISYSNTSVGTIVPGKDIKIQPPSMWLYLRETVITKLTISKCYSDPINHMFKITQCLFRINTKFLRWSGPCLLLQVQLSFCP